MMTSFRDSNRIGGKNAELRTLLGHNEEFTSEEEGFSAEEEAP